MKKNNNLFNKLALVKLDVTHGPADTFGCWSRVLTKCSKLVVKQPWLIWLLVFIRSFVIYVNKLKKCTAHVNQRGASSKWRRNERWRECGGIRFQSAMHHAYLGMVRIPRAPQRIILKRNRNIHIITASSSHTQCNCGGNQMSRWLKASMIGSQIHRPASRHTQCLGWITTCSACTAVRSRPINCGQRN